MIYRLLIGLTIVLTGCGYIVPEVGYDLLQGQILPSPDQANPEQSLLILINDRRLDLALPALITSTVLMDVAEAHSQDMAVNNYLAHVNLAGLHSYDRLVEAGYKFSYWGEVIAGGSTTPAVALDGWLDSPPHKAVLQGAMYQEIGLGFAFNSKTKHGYYWTVVVARPE